MSQIQKRYAETRAFFETFKYRKHITKGVVKVSEKNLKEAHLNYSSDYQQPHINNVI